MDAPIPLLTPRFIATVSAGDRHIENAAIRLNEEVAAYGTSFSAAGEVPGCTILTQQGASLGEHVLSHTAVAQSLLGVRMKEHLSDLVNALLLHRVFNAALVSRAIIETAAAIVYLQRKLEALMSDRSQDHLRAALDELHGSVARGRYPWDAWGNAAAMAEHVEAWREGNDPELSSDRRAINVLTMIRKLDQEFAERFADVARRSSQVDYSGAVRATYALLSDICHPAAGTGILLLEQGQCDGWIRVNDTTRDTTTRWLFSGPIGPLLLVPPVARLAYEALERLGKAALDPSQQ